MRTPVHRRPVGVLAAAAAVCAALCAVEPAAYATADSIGVGAEPAAGVTAAAADPANSPTLTAYRIVDSVGVDVHMSYLDTSYADSARVTDLLTGLGVRHVRDRVSGNSWEVPRLAGLEQHGIKLTLVVGGAAAGATQTVAAAKLAELDKLAAGLDAIEAPNEYDCSTDTAWAAHLHSYDTALADAVAADPTLAAVPLEGPSFCRPDDPAAYGTLETGYGVANAHDYARGQAPELALEARLPGMSAAAGAALPLAMTETGYTTDRNATGSATEATAADYTLRTLLDADRLGVARTYLYELLDEKPDPGLTDAEEHFGLVHYDYTPKPAYTAVANLLDDVSGGDPYTLSDPGRAAAPEPVTVGGGGSLLRSIDIAEPDGSITVALWLAEPIETTHGATPNTTADVTVRVTDGRAWAATTRRPSRGNSVVDAGTGTTFRVPVDGAVTLLHLNPAGPADAAPVCTSGAVAAAQAADGAVVTDPLTAGEFTGSPGTDPSVPDGAAGGTAITAAGQVTHVSTPSLNGSWTVTVWAKLGAASANDATFLRGAGLRGAELRTYDLADDVPSHKQVSGYGLPTTGGYGNEMWGQAQPGTWHLLSLTNTPTGARLAVDGVGTGSVTSSAATLNGVDLGSLSPGFRGSLAQFAVYPHALTSAQLMAQATLADQYCPPDAAVTASTLRIEAPHIANGPRTHITARLSDAATGTPIAGANLELIAAPTATGSDVPIAAARTDATGTARATVAIAATRYWHWSWTGSGGHEAAASTEVRVAAAPLVSARTARRHGRKWEITGRVTRTGGTKPRVNTQARAAAGRWTGRPARITLSRTAGGWRYRALIAVGRPGQRWRVCVTASGQVGTSATLTVPH